jgi:imidazolonepropionase-like amidohydrolase
VTGTDLAGWPLLSFNITELERLVEFGMTHVQAISAATGVAAELLRWEDKIGKVKPGLLADLIAVKKKHPDENVSELREIDFVMKDGVVVKQDGKPTENFL